MDKLFNSLSKMNPSPPPSAPLEPLPFISIPVSHPSPPAWNSVIRPLVPWSTGLCDCCDDLGICCLTCWCPCVTFGRIAEILDRGSTSCEVSGALYSVLLCVCWSSCLYSCFYRSKLRGQYFLEEGPCTDFCIHCCCEACALCQEYRELQNQGIDLRIGWNGNLRREKRKARMAPSTQEMAMKR